WRAGGRAVVTLSGIITETMQNITFSITLRE
ncbi:TPA: baseplate assembly protein, partial [Escherichia coli]